MSIGENIKKFREEKGVTQAQAAKELYMTPQMFCAIETGLRQPSLNVALALADYFGTTVEILAGREQGGMV